MNKMIEQPKLSEEEWMLIAELLERERGELHAEIHHTRTMTFRDELYHRKQVVDELLKCLAYFGAR